MEQQSTGVRGHVPLGVRPPAADLVSLLIGRGGFTLDVVRNRELREGIAVAADPRRSLVLDTDRWDHDRLGRWVDRCHDHAQRAEGEPLHIGGWLDPVRRVACFDVVQVFPGDRRSDALELARRLHQRAAFDLDAGRVIVVADALLGLT